MNAITCFHPYFLIYHYCRS